MNRGASYDTDVPSSDDHDDVLDTLVNLGVSEDTLDCVQSDPSLPLSITNPSAHILVGFR